MSGYLMELVLYLQSQQNRSPSTECDRPVFVLQPIFQVQTLFGSPAMHSLVSHFKFLRCYRPLQFMGLTLVEKNRRNKVFRNKETSLSLSIHSVRMVTLRLQGGTIQMLGVVVQVHTSMYCYFLF